jgi:hypothetical protein
MKKSLSISLFLLVAFSIFTFSGLAQSGGPVPYPPCNPCIASIDGDSAAAMVSDAVSAVNSFEASLGSTGGAESFYSDLNDSLATDGSEYFQMTLGVSEPKVSVDIY